MNSKTAQTIVAVADAYYHDNSGLAFRIYNELGQGAGGFPGIWNKVADFAMHLDARFSEAWEEEERDFVADVKDITRDFMKESLSFGKFIHPGSLFPIGHWEEDPDYPSSDWREEVANNDTRLGYADWVKQQKEKRE